MDVTPDTVICVENGSLASESHIVRAQASIKTRFIETPRNIGFPAAVNLAMQAAISAGADWTLLLNNDAIVSARCLQICLEHATKNPRVAAVSPAIAFLRRPDLLWYGGGKASGWLTFTRHVGLMSPASKPPISRDTGFTTGCCMLVSSAAWRALGPFRAEYFAYYEDAEWCHRAREAGWHCRYVGEVLCFHSVSASFGLSGERRLSEDTAYYKARNPLRFALDTPSRTRRITRIFGVFLIWSLYHVILIVRSLDLRIARAYARGIIDAFHMRMGPYHQTSL